MSFLEASMPVSLVPFQQTHLEATRDWINSPQVTRYFLFDRYITVSDHKCWFERLSHDHTQVLLAIMHDSYGHIGNIGFKKIDRKSCSAEFWIYIGQTEKQGQKIGSRAIDIAVEYAFDRLGLKIIYLHVLPENKAAIHIYEKAGFSHEDELAEWESSSGRMVLIRMVCFESCWRAKRQLGPRVTLMQPAFLSWLGYFELLDRSDIFVFLDDFQFSRQSWGQRNKMFLSPGRVGMISLPIRHKKNLAATFIDIQPGYDDKWIKKLLSSLRQAYARAPYVNEVSHLLTRWFSDPHVNLSSFLTSFTKLVVEYLGLQTTLLFSSQIDHDRNAKRSWRVLSLLKSLKARVYYSPQGSFGYMREDALFPLESLPVYFQDYVPFPYPQADNTQFAPYLSVVDALCNLDPTHVKAIMRGTQKWLTWEELVNKQDKKTLRK